MQTAAKIFVIFGPSGSGKSTLLKRLFRDFPDTFGFSVSHTTRKPRSGEIDGKDYYFVEKDDMIKQVQEGKFIESAIYSGNMYGTSLKAVEDVVHEGKICMLDVDTQGVQSIKKTGLKPKYIYVRPPSMEVLKSRLEKRGTESDESLADRLKAAVTEMNYGDEDGSHDVKIINEKLDEAYDLFKKAIFVNPE
ncbi:guanylate kinase [Parasitella parasitica]|nr:guanylate kinase [Parasitella parasitica]